MTATQTISPFQKAKSVRSRPKLLLWGDSGVGKTTLALQFPKPVVLDMERGTELYGGDFEFDVLRTTNADSAMEAIDWLATNRHEFRTLVVDPITVYWDALQKKWSEIYFKRKRGTKAHKQDYYELQPNDYGPIKAELKAFVRKILALDMNVVVTAREKPLYDEGEFMRKIGVTFDGEKSLPYMFDTVVHLYRDDAGGYMGRVSHKDRSKKLPTEAFTASYDLFAELFGADELNREATPSQLASPQQVNRIKAALETLRVPEDTITARLAAYDVQRVEDLPRDNAREILQKLEAAVAAQSASKDQPDPNSTDDHNQAA